MNNFGEFLCALRKEKGMTQAELANALNVTNKAVSKWETGEAMPETALLLPIAQIFGVTVDELLKGERNERRESNNGENEDNSQDGVYGEIKGHLFTRGKDDEPKPLSEKICGAVCGALMIVGITVYLFLGALASLWTPYWVIIPVCAMTCGMIGIIFDLANPVKRAKKAEHGENAYVGAVCGMVMLISNTAFLLAGVLTGLWHPLWVIVVGGMLVCVVTGLIGGVFTHKK